MAQIRHFMVTNPGNRPTPTINRPFYEEFCLTLLSTRIELINDSLNQV